MAKILDGSRTPTAYQNSYSAKLDADDYVTLRDHVGWFDSGEFKLHMLQLDDVIDVLVTLRDEIPKVRPA